MKKFLLLLFACITLSGCSWYSFDLPKVENIPSIDNKKTVKIEVTSRFNRYLEKYQPKTDLFNLVNQNPDYTVQVGIIGNKLEPSTMDYIYSGIFLVSLTTIPLYMDGYISFIIQDNKTGQFIKKKTDILVKEWYGILVPVPWVSGPYSRFEKVVENTWPSLYQEIAKEIYYPKSMLHTSKNKCEINKDGVRECTQNPYEW